MQAQAIPVHQPTADLADAAVAAQIASLSPNQIADLCRQFGITIPDRPAIARCADCGAEAITRPYCGDSVCAGCRVARESFLDEMALASERQDVLDAHGAEEAGLSLTNRSHEH